MMTIRIRPSGARTDAEVYDPASSFDNIYPKILEATINGCRRDQWPAWLVWYARAFGISEVELSVAVDRFVQGVLILKQEPQLHHPDEAFERSGFNAVALPIKIAVYARLGQQTTGAFWTRARHVIDDPVVGVSPSLELQRIARLANQNAPTI